MLDTGLSILNSIVGGAIIAIASSLHLYLQGKITGISGALYKCLKKIEFNYNIAFVCGMLFTSTYIKFFSDPLRSKKRRQSFLEEPNGYAGDLTIIGFIIAGFLVGFGSRMGNGCTSGHGVCGLPRLSKRSIVAVCLFMIFGGCSATFNYYFSFFRPGKDSKIWVISPRILPFILFCVAIAGLSYTLYMGYKSGVVDRVRDYGIAFGIGALFSFGLIESGMVQRHTVSGFLTLGFAWNIRLVFVLGAAVGINYFTFNYILTNFKKPLFADKFDLPESNKVDNKLVVGASIFGIGWGLSGVCPGPAIIASYMYLPQSLLLFAATLGGIYVESLYDKKITEFVNKNAILSKVTNLLESKYEEVERKIK